MTNVRARALGRLLFIIVCFLFVVLTPTGEHDVALGVMTGLVLASCLELTFP